MIVVLGAPTYRLVVRTPGTHRQEIQFGPGARFTLCLPKPTQRSGVLEIILPIAGAVRLEYDPEVGMLASSRNGAVAATGSPLEVVLGSVRVSGSVRSTGLSIQVEAEDSPARAEHPTEVPD